MFYSSRNTYKVYKTNLIMGIFSKKKSDVLDLSRDYHQTHRTSRPEKDLDLTHSEPASQPVSSGFPFFGGGSQAQNNFPSESSEEDFDSPEEKKRKFAKRLVDMTNRIEELDNKLYHLQQRVEVLEKKEGLSGFESSNSNGLASF
jgi:hypothetical protein